MSFDKEQDTASLWESFKAHHDKESRDKLVEHYLPLVNIVAGRLAISLPPHIARDDLISSGFFGLMDAVERFDSSRANKFETYAGVRIRGAMVDYLRSCDWMPTSLRHRIREFESSVSALENRLGRSATDGEIATEMGMSTDELNSLVMKLNVATVIPLDDYVKSETPEKAVPDPSVKLEKKEMQSVLGRAIDRLPEKERQVVALYYYEELTMKEVSLVLNISEARVCQLHTKAIFRLRGYLARAKAASLF